MMCNETKLVSKDKINYIYVVDNKKHILVNLSTPDEFNNEENFGGTHNTIFNLNPREFPRLAKQAVG